jgi:hypothetical protein
MGSGQRLLFGRFNKLQMGQEQESSFAEEDIPELLHLFGGAIEAASAAMDCGYGK